VGILNALGRVALASGDLEQARARYREALSSSEELADLEGIARALCGLGDVALIAGDVLDARQRFRRLLQIALKDQRESIGREALISLAKLVAHREQERAVELVALSLCKDPGFPWQALPDAEALLGKLRSGLSPEVYATAQERGRARDLWATAEELLAELEKQKEIDERDDRFL
jgi:tetratricopeptide (TPR) repeat protein